AAVKRFVQQQMKENKSSVLESETPEDDEENTWREQLLAVLLKMDPSAFERLTQRLLRESGFIQVEVTGRSGDGGIDGKGIMRLGGLLSFHVIFQCKRYKGAVTVGHVRDFRGAMVGRADKGLLITTGNFTKDAMREATRDGAPAIDLIDGDLLIEKLKELDLGVKTDRVEIEKVTVDRDWFLSI
ncbi:MAG: restriction endonuclease, partial [Cryomorphaceae bacterium]|nr:restriction endonuclease [Cryomorphaceae bacterium]